MEHPLINTIWYDKDTNDPRSGTKMLLYTVEGMPNIKENEKRRCQLFDNGYRVSTENYKEEYWDKLTYEDIDYKNWINYWEKHDKSKIVPPEEIYEKIIRHLATEYTNNAYYAELSRSGKGFHFLFYWDVPRTKEWRDKCKKLGARIIKTAFIKCGYEEIINFDGKNDTNKVFDGCSNSVFQLCYITKNKYWINRCCNGIWTEYDGLAEIEEKKAFKKFSLNNDQYIINTTKTLLDDTYKVEYIDHYERWALYTSLRLMFPDTYEEEYEYCCDHMTQGDHNTQWFKDMTEGSSWDKKFEENTDEYFVNKDLVKKFGYDVTITKKTRKRSKIEYLNLLGL